MTAQLPQGTPMGELRLVETYINFDGPRLFACKNAAGTYFFSVYADADDEFETFIYAPASFERFAAVRAGQLSLRVAFQDPPDGGVFVVTTSVESADQQVRWMAASEVDEALLPGESAWLELPTDTQPRLDPDELHREAEAVGRTLTAFELDAPWATTEFPLRSVGDVMRLVQESVDSFAQIVKDRRTNRGAVQQDILEEAELSLYDLRAASFAFVVATSPAGRLFETPLVAQALHILLNVMDAATMSDDTLHRALLELHPRSLSKYRDLLEELDDARTGLLALLAPPRSAVRVARLSRDAVLSSLQLVRKQMEPETQEVEIEALLVGVNARTRSFELLDDTTDQKYSGKAIDSARDQIFGLTIGDRYIARLLRETEIQPVTGELHYKYRLREIRLP